MPVPDFSPGEILTSSAMDSIGLWLVKTQTVGNGVSSVEVTGAFSADFANYRIVWAGTDSSVSDFAVIFRLGATTTNYFGNMTTYKIGTGQGFLPVNNNLAGLYMSITAGENDTGMVMDITNPFAASRTTMTSQGFGFLSQFTCAGIQASTTSFTSFTLIPGSGTMTGGTIRVYGYRN